MTFGQRIVAARKTRRISQSALAKAIGMSQPTLRKIEQREKDSIELYNARSIAMGLGMSLGELLGESKPLQPSLNGSPVPAETEARYVTIAEFEQLQRLFVELSERLAVAAALTGTTILQNPPSAPKQQVKAKRDRPLSGSRKSG